jgi:hypothetical protein
MPAVYRLPNQPGFAAPPLTYYKVFTGPQAPFEGKRQMKSADIKDGQSNTIAIIEAATPIEWTKPDDIVFDPAKFKLADVGALGAPTFNVVMFDGSVYNYPRNIDINKLKALITLSGKKNVKP